MQFRRVRELRLVQKWTIPPPHKPQDESEAIGNYEILVFGMAKEYVGLKHDGKAPIENLEQGSNRAKSHRSDIFHQGITGECSIEQLKVQV